MSSKKESNILPLPLLIFLGTWMIFSPVLAQKNANFQQGIRQIVDQTKSYYEIDQRLANGIYFENEYRTAVGHPFFKSQDFLRGNLVYRNSSFEDKQLKYDIYTQRLLVKHDAEDYQLITYLYNEFVQSFSLDGVRFKRLEINDFGPRFYRVIYEDPSVQCYAYLTKIRYEQINEDRKKIYTFKDNKSKKYLLINGDSFSFRNNRTFLRILPKPIRKSVDSYLNSGRIKLNKLADEEISDLIAYCSELTSSMEGRDE